MYSQERTMLRGRSQCEGNGRGMTGTLLAIGNARSVANFSHQRVCHAFVRHDASSSPSTLSSSSPFHRIPRHGIFRRERQSSRKRECS